MTPGVGCLGRYDGLPGGGPAEPIALAGAGVRGRLDSRRAAVRTGRPALVLDCDVLNRQIGNMAPIPTAI
ncbi:hypothetical protein BDK92_3660 [Micromonospora pisi]|uniref:Uncharacterized protein n=1 Tax=Micromonospora pisi TaxID=589240 RepID=A0A495JJW9_9ACTN|nr:hypothetical protein BDK92_3660 [Micromonospora pisi]